LSRGMGGEMASWGEYAGEVLSEIEIISHLNMIWYSKLGPESPMQSPIRFDALVLKSRFL